jgi:hypothetical protein
MLHSRPAACLRNFEHTITRRFRKGVQESRAALWVKSSAQSSRKTPSLRTSIIVSTQFSIQGGYRSRLFGGSTITQPISSSNNSPPAMPPSPAKKQKLSANANEHLEQEPHEMSAIAGNSDDKDAEDSNDKDPYPNGTNHESRGKHDTTTTHEDEEKEKQKEGGEWRCQPPYRTSEENEHFEKKHEAQCNCGRIKYWLSRDAPLASKYCHCKDCQSLHGKPRPALLTLFDTNTNMRLLKYC